MADTTLSIQIQVQSQELKRLRKEHDTLVRKIQGDWKTTSRRVKTDSDRMFKGLKTGFAAVGAAMAAMKIVQFGRDIVQVGVRMEGLRNGLLAVEGSTKAASKAMKELQEIALLPGISLSQAIEARINLRAVKLNADLANRSIKAMGNALAIVGKSDELTGVVLGMTQMASAGKVLQEEINQISSRIPMFRQAMKDAFGTARSEEIQKMGISVETFLGKTVAELEKLPRVTEGAGAAISNLGNSLNTFKDVLFTNFLPQFQSTVEFMSRVVDKASGLIRRKEDTGIGISGIETPLLRERAKFASASDAFITNRAIGGGRFELDMLTEQIQSEFRNAFVDQRKRLLVAQLAEVNALRRQFQTGAGVFAGERDAGARRQPAGIRAGLGGVPSRRQGIGATSTIPPGQNTPLSRRIREPFERGGGFDAGAAQGLTLRRDASGSVITQFPTTRGLQRGGTAGFTPVQGTPLGGANTAPFLPILRPDIQPIPAPDRLPIGAREFAPFGKKFEAGMQQITISSLRATATITSAFANMAAGMENSMLQITASVLDMVTRILNVVNQGGGGNIGGALTALGVGAGAATGLGVSFAVAAGGVAVLNTINSSRSQSQSQRVQTRFLRTN